MARYVRRRCSATSAPRRPGALSVEVHLWVRELTRDRPRAGADAAVPLVRRRRRRVGRRPATPRTSGRRSRRSTAGTAAAPAGASRCRPVGTDLDVDDDDIRRDHAGQRGPVPPAAAPRRPRPRPRCRRRASTPTGCAGSRVHTASCSPAAGRGRPRPARRVGAAGAHPRRRRRRRATPATTPARPAGSGTASASSAARSRPSCRWRCRRCSAADLDPRRRRRWSSPTACRTPRTAPGSCRPARTASPCARAARGGRRRRADARHAGRAGRSSAPATTPIARYRHPAARLRRPRASPRSGRRRPCAKVPAAVRTRVRKRLAFDAALEFGLQSRLGRTLELTGTVAAEVEAGARADGRRRPTGARRGRRGSSRSLGRRPTGDATLVPGCAACSSACAARARSSTVVRQATRRRTATATSSGVAGPAREGMPAFPIGRPAPGFPRVGGAGRPAARTSSTRSPRAQSWYARGPSRCSASARAEAGGSPGCCSSGSPATTSSPRRPASAAPRCTRSRRPASSSPRAELDDLARRAAPAGLRRLPGAACPAPRPPSTSSTARRA